METVLFLIVVGILSSIFSRAKGKGDFGRPKPFAAKGFNNRRTLSEELPASSAKPISTGVPAAANNSTKLDPPKLDTETGNGGRMHSPNSQSNLSVKKESLVTDNRNHNSLINGIIWSEILSEPRAKRPYSLKKR